MSDASKYERFSIVFSPMHATRHLCSIAFQSFFIAPTKTCNDPTPLCPTVEDFMAEARPAATVCVHVSPGLNSVAEETGTEKVSDWRAASGTSQR